MSLYVFILQPDWWLVHELVECVANVFWRPKCLRSAASATDVCFDSKAFMRTLWPWESMESGFLGSDSIPSSKAVQREPCMTWHAKKLCERRAFWSQAPLGFNKILPVLRQGSHRLASYVSCHWTDLLDLFWSRIEWPSPAGLSPSPNGQRNYHSLPQVLAQAQCSCRSLRKSIKVGGTPWTDVDPCGPTPLSVAKRAWEIRNLGVESLVFVSLVRLTLSPHWVREIECLEHQSSHKAEAFRPWERSMFCSKHASTSPCKSPSTARHSTFRPWASNTSGFAP